MATRKVELFLSPSGSQCRLLLDGEEVNNCRAVAINASVDEATIVTFELIDVDVSVTGDIDSEAANALSVAPKIVELTSLDDSNRRFKAN